MAEKPYQPPLIPDLELGSGRPFSERTRLPTHSPKPEFPSGPGELDPDELDPDPLDLSPLELGVEANELAGQPILPDQFPQPEWSTVLEPTPVAHSSWTSPKQALCVLSLHRRLLFERTTLRDRLTKAELEWFEHAQNLALSFDPRDAPSGRYQELLGQLNDKRGQLAPKPEATPAVHHDLDVLGARVAASDEELAHARADEESSDLNLRRARGRYQRAQIELRAEQARSNPPSERIALERLNELTQEIAIAEAKAIQANRHRIAVERSAHALHLELRRVEDRLRGTSKNLVATAPEAEAGRREVGAMAIELAQVWLTSPGRVRSIDAGLAREFRRSSADVAALREELEGVERTIASLKPDAARRSLLVSVVLLGLALLVLVLWLG